MLKQNSELRAQAREALRGKWPMAAVAALIYSAIAGGLSSIPFIGRIGRKPEDIAERTYAV